MNYDEPIKYILGYLLNFDTFIIGLAKFKYIKNELEIIITNKTNPIK